MTIQKLCESSPFLISQIANGSVVQVNPVLGKCFFHATTGSRSHPVNQPRCFRLTAVSGFLKIIMHNALCLRQVEIFPLLGLVPPSRALSLEEISLTFSGLGAQTLIQGWSLQVSCCDFCLQLQPS